MEGKYHLQTLLAGIQNGTNFEKKKIGGFLRGETFSHHIIKLFFC